MMPADRPPMPADAAWALRPGLRLGPHELTACLGRGLVTEAWAAHDMRRDRPVRLMVTREPVPATALRERCLDDARRAARLRHPRLAGVLEIASAMDRPHVVCPADEGAPAEPPDDAQPGGRLRVAVRRGGDLLEALAYAHEGGVAHGDLGPHALWLDARGRLQIWGTGLGVALAGPAPGGLHLSAREVTGAGALIEGWLGDEDVPEDLAAMLRRARHAAPAQRFLHARSFERALAEWQESLRARPSGDLDARLAARLQRAGPLPARPSLVQRVARASAIERRLDEVVDGLLEDPALGLAMLRLANTGEVRHGAATLRRALALAGTQGLRRASAMLRPWPGGLSEARARACAQALERALLAGHLAEFLTPAGIDPEVALLVAQYQHLGRLLALYHFPDELARQGLRETDRPVEAGALDDALQAAVGGDTRDLAAAFLRQWGLAELYGEAIVPCPPQRPVTTPMRPAGWPRIIASCANELLVHLDEPDPAQSRGLSHVMDRYRRTLGLEEKPLRRAIALARDKLAHHLR